MFNGGEPAGSFSISGGETHGDDTATCPSGAPAVIRARFRMSLADDLWVTDLSTRYPKATFRLLTGVPKGDRALELGEVRTDRPDAVTESIRSHPDIRTYDVVFLGESRAIAQYEAESKRLYEFLWNSSLPPEFPIVVENGEMEFDLTATRSQFDEFTAALTERDNRYELLSLVHTDDEESLLTDRQRECLRAALRAGYFEVPRECTLSELADDLAVDKSTASETIRRGQARILEEYLMSEK